MNSKKTQHPATEAAIAQAAEAAPETVPVVTTPVSEPISPVASEDAVPVKAGRRSTVKKAVLTEQATVAPPKAKKTERIAKPAKTVKASKVEKAPKAVPDVVVDKAAKAADKPVKAKKTRLVRDSYAMPDNEYQRIGDLKKRLAGLSAEYKKSELLRAGIALLAALNDSELVAVMAGVERIKTGRPRKK